MSALVKYDRWNEKAAELCVAQRKYPSRGDLKDRLKQLGKGKTSGSLRLEEKIIILEDLHFKATQEIVKIRMAIILRYTWEVSNEEEFKRLHRVFEDQYLEKAGVKQMYLLQELSGPGGVYFAWVSFENWAGLDKWDDLFNTEEAKNFAEQIRKTAKPLDRTYLREVDYWYKSLRII